MITRSNYVNGKATFDQYYGEIVDECGIKFSDAADIARFREALKTDEHMNNIPLSWWDARALGLESNPAVRAALKSRGDGYSMAGGVCILKAAARKAVQS